MQSFRTIYGIGVKTHFTLLVVVLLNFIAKENLLVSLNYSLIHKFTLLIYLSGIILFFSSSKSSKKLRRYFLLYLLSPFVGLVLFLFGGLLFTILVYLFFSPLFPFQLVAESHPITVYQKPQGPLGACCPYLLTEKKYGILEKEIGEIDFYENLNIDTISKQTTKGNYILKITYTQHDHKLGQDIQTDTILVIK